MKTKENNGDKKGISLIVLVITIIVLLILTSTLIYNAKGSIHIQNTTKLYNDLELLREKYRGDNPEIRDLSVYEEAMNGRSVVNG